MKNKKYKSVGIFLILLTSILFLIGCNKETKDNKNNNTHSTSTSTSINTSDNINTSTTTEEKTTTTDIYEELLSDFTYRFEPFFSTHVYITGVKDKNIKNIVVPDCVWGIDSCAFAGCSKLESITLNLDNICGLNYKYNQHLPFADYFGSEYYEGSINIMQAIFDSSDEFVGYFTYYIPENLKTIIIKGAYNIYKYAFSGLETIENIEIYGYVTAIHEKTFWYCTSLKSIILPDCIEEIGERAFFKCESLEEVTLPNDLKIIGEYAFEYCEKLKTINFSKKIKTIGVAAFSECKSLESVVIPSSVTKLDPYAFSGCISLKNVKITSVLRLQDGLFDTCLAFVIFEVPDCIIGINNDAFFGCFNLEGVVLPKNIRSIDEDAFVLCDKLTSVYYKGTYPYTNTITNMKSEELLNAKWYYFTENGKNETQKGDWWYYDTDGVIKTLVKK